MRIIQRYYLQLKQYRFVIACCLHDHHHAKLKAGAEVSYDMVSTMLLWHEMSSSKRFAVSPFRLSRNHFSCVLKASIVIEKSVTLRKLQSHGRRFPRYSSWIISYPLIRRPPPSTKFPQRGCGYCSSRQPMPFGRTLSEPQSHPHAWPSVG